MSLPVDLRVLCRRLTSTSPDQLVRDLPSLSNQLLRCRGILSQPQDQKVKDTSSEASVLVHKLKTIVSALINGKSHSGRFAGAVLVKAIVDAGGWEIVRSSEPWVRGLLTILQKPDSFAAKSLSLVALGRIYTLIQPYQTLVREIATPTIPAFITACLQLLKSHTVVSQSRAAPLTPLSLCTTICDVLSTLVPLYPTTLRPFGSQIKTAVKPFLAPTSTDKTTIPRELRRSSRKLVISLHHTAPKAGGSDEWKALAEGLLREAHHVADQILRAVVEVWDSQHGHKPLRMNLEALPQGGSSNGTKPEDLPLWEGIRAGSERLVGLLGFIADTLRYPTQSAVQIPVSAILDLVTRLTLISRRNPRRQTWEQALQTRPAVERAEREDLWAAMPDVHVATLDLTHVLTLRLGSNIVPVGSEIVECCQRVLRSGVDVPLVRTATYTLVAELLKSLGLTMAKESVASLELTISACCKDLQRAAGYIGDTANSGSGAASTATTNGASGSDAKKKNNGQINIDLLLQAPSASTAQSSAVGAQAGIVSLLDPDHLAAAQSLLVTLLSNVPQRYLKPSLRGLLDQTAIVTGNRNALLASVLNPFRDQTGRMYASILPFLTQRFARDQSLEILRTNLRNPSTSSSNDNGLYAAAEDDEMEEDDDDEDGEDGEDQDETTSQSGNTSSAKAAKKNSPTLGDSDDAEAQLLEESFQATTRSRATSSVDLTNKMAAMSNPFKPQPDSESKTTVSAKRPFDGNHDVLASPSKRRETLELRDSMPSFATATMEAKPDPTVPRTKKEPVADDVEMTTDNRETQGGVESDDDDDDDDSVHLNMEFDDEEDDDDDGQ